MYLMIGGSFFESVFKLYETDFFWQSYVATALVTIPIVLLILLIYNSKINKMKDQLAQVDKRVKLLSDWVDKRVKLLSDRLNGIKAPAAKTEKPPVDRPAAVGHGPNEAEEPPLTNMRQAEEQYAQGMRYSEGDGVEKDLEQAVRCFRKAADAGYAPAQFVMAACFHTGYGVDEDPAQAAEWYRKAAEQGHAEAQFNLGACYASGYGVKKDPDQAIDWYRKAAAQGNEDAKAALREIAPPIFRVNA